MTSTHIRAADRRVPLVVSGVAVISLATTVLLVVATIRSIGGRPTALWILGRATGITAYVLLVLVVLAGLVLSHPWRSRIPRPPVASRIRIHIVVAVLALVLVAAHAAVLASDRYAGVGTRGAFIPFASTYRPTSVTLGVIGAWLGVIVGVTAGLAGRLPARAWWPLHKVAAAVLVLCWAHAAFAGSDTAQLRWFYLGTAIVVGVVALSRYTAWSPADRRREHS